VLGVDFTIVSSCLYIAIVCDYRDGLEKLGIVLSSSAGPTSGNTRAQTIEISGDCPTASSSNN
jgi:hypothetical protein